MAIGKAAGSSLALPLPRQKGRNYRSYLVLPPSYSVICDVFADFVVGVTAEMRVIGEEMRVIGEMRVGADATTGDGVWVIERMPFKERMHVIGLMHVVRCGAP